MLHYVTKVLQIALHQSMQSFYIVHVEYHSEFYPPVDFKVHMLAWSALINFLQFVMN